MAASRSASARASAATSPRCPARSSSTAPKSAGTLITRNGDIELTDGARVRGGIHVKKNNDSGWSWGKDEPIEVHICATCVVDGELRFERPVELRVDAGAKIGKVIGDSVTRR